MGKTKRKGAMKAKTTRRAKVTAKTGNGVTVPAAFKKSLGNAATILSKLQAAIA